MTRALLSVAGILLAGLVCADERGSSVKFEDHLGYGERETSGLKGESSYLAFTDLAKFNRTFEVGQEFPLGKPFNLIPRDAWGKVVVLAVIKRGPYYIHYDVDRVTRTGDRLTIHYRTTRSDRLVLDLACPLVVSVERAGCREAVFVENGREVARVFVG